jgi:hypothetical protein
MIFGLTDPVVLVIAVPVCLYLVCLAIALLALFPGLRVRGREAAERFQVELKASLRSYSAESIDPMASPDVSGEPVSLVERVGWLRSLNSGTRQGAGGGAG